MDSASRPSASITAIAASTIRSRDSGTRDGSDRARPRPPGRGGAGSAFGSNGLDTNGILSLEQCSSYTNTVRADRLDADLEGSDDRPPHPHLPTHHRSTPG